MFYNSLSHSYFESKLFEIPIIIWARAWTSWLQINGRGVIATLLHSSVNQKPVVSFSFSSILSRTTMTRAQQPCSQWGPEKAHGGRCKHVKLKLGSIYEVESRCSQFLMLVLFGTKLVESFGKSDFKPLPWLAATHVLVMRGRVNVTLLWARLDLTEPPEPHS